MVEIGIQEKSPDFQSPEVVISANLTKLKLKQDKNTTRKNIRTLYISGFRCSQCN